MEYFFRFFCLVFPSIRHFCGSGRFAFYFSDRAAPRINLPSASIAAAKKKDLIMSFRTRRMCGEAKQKKAVNTNYDTVLQGIQIMKKKTSMNATLAL